jgi:trehalose/maltose hydrolase-like predicted phosphorylase
LLEAGAEILLETARFWASRAAQEMDGQYHSQRHRSGYHEYIDDNAYTNVLAVEPRWDWMAKLAERWPGAGAP